ncbi:exonuclease domain-containing protein [Rhodococcus jostii]|uniref:3'-5' exonuclease n=1 Tax=Rhodococcus jostii TaxID=132919 RepID=UPI00362CF87F
MIVVDIETTSLDTKRCTPPEIAVVNVQTQEAFSFAPYVSRDALTDADPQALAVNRYFERRVFEKMLDLDESRKAERAFGLLSGNTFAGSNPSFDAAVLDRFGAPGWHHRLADLAPFAAGVLGLDPTQLPGLATVCELLDVENTDPHSALGDALATAECFRVLQERAA